MYHVFKLNNQNKRFRHYTPEEKMQHNDRPAQVSTHQNSNAAGHLVVPGEEQIPSDGTDISDGQSVSDAQTTQINPTMTMTPQQAARILAQHTVTLCTERDEAFAYLARHGHITLPSITPNSTSAASPNFTDILKTMHTATTADIRDLSDPRRRIDIVQARWKSASWICEALSVATRSMGGEFRRLVDEEIGVAVRKPAEGIFVSFSASLV